ncbi:MAG: sigma 54-interacting transcriptional regulator [Syntrophomonadaceae bacterium]
MSDNPQYTQKRTEAIINSLYNGVVAINTKGIITIFNPSAERIWGISVTDALGKHIEEMVPDSGLYKALQIGENQSYQRQAVGDKVVMANRNIVKVDGKVIGAISVFEDITEFEKIAHELERVKLLEATLTDVIENPYEGIIVVDKEGLVTMINDTYLKIVGREREDVLGKPISHISENCNLPQVLKTGEPLLCDFCNVRDQGLITMRVPIVKDGKLVGAFGKTLFTDINVAKVLNNKLNKLERQLDYYKEEYMKIHSARYSFNDIVGESDSINSVVNMAFRIAQGISTVLITGESGTGKELFAQAIHGASERSKNNFIKVNCAAIPDNLLESELFGYVEGAFTGARKGGKPGKFELANKGTIFLDEIGDMPMVMQAKLLRVLQEREVERVGSTEPIYVDVRVIAATNRDIEKLVEQGKFREDLYYRLNIVQINIPPLREHLEDIPILVDALIPKLNAKINKQMKGMTKEAITLLQQYNWPGNIRELENMLELAINMSDKEYLVYEDFPCIVMKLDTKGRIEKNIILLDAKAITEKNMILNALKQSNGDKKIAASILAIHPSALYRKLKKYDIKYEGSSHLN